MSTQSTVLLPTTPAARVVRPAAVVPTDCPLASVRTLRKRVQKRLDEELQKKLRQSYFVGVVSEQRCLVQYQEELCMLQHHNLAEALFYQLALARFGGNTVAKMGSPLQVQVLIEQFLQIVEDIQDESLGLTESSQEQQEIKVNETNALVAKQATACLRDKAPMLEEYFGIVLEQQAKPQDDDSEDKTELVLTGLPILLEGHAPPPDDLPLFLLRLATEVDWEEERPCFDDVCRELGGFYAELPSQEGERNAAIQHTLFPAISCLLMPSRSLQEDVEPLTLLSNLNKVFERV